MSRIITSFLAKIRLLKYSEPSINSYKKTRLSVLNIQPYNFTFLSKVKIRLVLCKY